MASENKMKLVKSEVDKVKAPTKGQAFYWDNELHGFGLRVTPGGTKSYIVQARVNGKERRVTLGRHGKLTPDEARKKATKTFAQMLDGKDPIVERKRNKATQVTLKEISDQYIRERSLKPSSIDGIEKHINNVFSDWANRPIVSITRDKVSTRFMEYSKRAPAQANQAFRIFRALWNYARESYLDEKDNYLLPENPANVLSGKKIWNPVKSRSKKIPISKMGAVWNHIQEIRERPKLKEVSRAAIDLTAFLIVSGTRFTETASLTWDRVNLEEGWWRIDDPKNNHPVILPLSKLAKEILMERPRDEKFAFPSNSKKGYIADIRDNMKKISKIVGENLVVHDLRRTFRSIAVEARVEDWKVRLLMNHKSNNDIALTHYTETSDLRYLLDDVQAISDWIEHQAKIASNGNVIALNLSREEVASE
jgi:integrase